MSIFKREPKETPSLATVLIVSDDPATASILKDTLQEKGYTVHSTSTEVEAIDLLNEIELPQLFVLDFLRPQTDGEAFLRRAKIRLGHSALPPVLLVADAAEDEMLAHTIGVEDMLHKPLVSETLLECVERLTGSVKKQG